MTPAGRRLVVSAVDDAAAVRTLTLVAESGALPGYVPGSHLLVECGARSNAYSLLDDGVAPDAYRISVLHRPHGSGGSRWLHGRRVGDVVIATAPRSAFAPVASAHHHLLIAGGIGITPLVSHARAAQRWGRSYSLLYRYRAGAHLPELRALCGPRLTEYTDRESFAAGCRAALVRQPLGTHLYVCGPAAFSDGVLAAARDAGWPATRLHTERFGADVLDAGRAFRVRVGPVCHDVPAGVSMLEALERAGHTVPFRCRQGVCGECLLPVVAGRVEHRDLFLSDEEKGNGDQLLPCVSRALDEVVEVAV